MQALADIFVGKRVEVKIPFRNDQGKVVPNKFDTVCGVCKYIGPNEILGWAMQVTIGRMPIPIRHIYDVKLI